MLIETKNLTRIYQVGEITIPALQDVSINIDKGEFVAITGKSGAGKSTLLYQLGLLDEPTSGSIKLDGKETSEMTDRERTIYRLSNLGYIFQDYALLPELTAEGNIIVPLLMQGVAISDAKERALEVLSRMGLGDRADNVPSQLSGGEQQRVSVARAIGNKPYILFADEPTASLDTEMSQIVIDYLKELHASGQTIIMVTHEEEYSSQTERIIELRDGKVIDDKKL